MSKHIPSRTYVALVLSPSIAVRINRCARQATGAKEHHVDYRCFNMGQTAIARVPPQGDYPTSRYSTRYTNSTHTYHVDARYILLIPLPYLFVQGEILARVVSSCLFEQKRPGSHQHRSASPRCGCRCIILLAVASPSHEGKGTVYPGKGSKSTTLAVLSRIRNPESGIEVECQGSAVCFGHPCNLLLSIRPPSEILSALRCRGDLLLPFFEIEIEIGIARPQSSQRWKARHTSLIASPKRRRPSPEVSLVYIVYAIYFDNRLTSILTNRSKSESLRGSQAGQASKTGRSCWGHKGEKIACPSRRQTSR